MKVYNLDYGANLFETGGKIYLFDCGTKAIGRNSVVPFIKQMYPHVSRVEAIFISHWHNNHTGGIPLVMHEFEVGHIYSNGTYSDDPKPAYAIDPIVEAEIKTLIDELNVPYTYFKKGDDFAENGLQFIPWSPLLKYFTDGGRTDYPNGPTGMILQVKYGDFSVVFGGDISNADTMQEIWSDVGDVSTNVYFWPHHGDFSAARDSVIDPMNLDLTMIETVGNSSRTIEWLQGKGIDYMWLRESVRSGIEAKNDGTFIKLENDRKKIFKPKGNLPLPN